MTKYALILPFLLAACSDGLRLKKPVADAPVSAAIAPDDVIRPPQRPGERAEGEVDVAVNETSGPEAPASGGDLGVTIASLGNAAEPGLWLKTPLVKVEGPGTVAYNGKTAQANLIPIEGPATAGSRASLQLMQALGAPLTGLPEFRVSR